LVEYMPCMHEVIGSNPIVSTSKNILSRYIQNQVLTKQKR